MKTSLRTQPRIIIIYALSFYFFYVIYNVFGTYEVFHDSISNHNKSRLVATLNNLRLARSLVRDNDMDDAVSSLKLAYDDGKLDLFVIKQGRDVLAYAARTGYQQDALRNYPIGEYDDGDWYLGTFEENGIRVTAGIARNEKAFWLQLIKKNWLRILLDTIIVVMTISGFLLYFFRDIFFAIKVFQGKDRKQLAHIKSNSYESKVFIEGLRSYEESLNRLTSEGEAFKRLILSGIRHEAQSGHEPPYDFYCTLVRTDINQFSKIFNSNSSDQFLRFMNEFFTEVTEVVDRYNGFIYEFIGDEVIYYFKDSETENSTDLALSAVRDINKVADSIHERTKDKLFPFRVKTSVAYGKLRFGRLVEGFSLSGSVLIETVRVLSLVQERDINSTFISEEVVKKMTEIFKEQSEGTVELKGIHGPYQLYSLKSTLPIEDVLDELNGATVHQLRLYRNSHDIAYFIKFLRINLEKVPYGLLMKSLSFITELRNFDGHDMVKNEYEMLIETLIEKTIRSPELGFQNVLAQTIMCAGPLFSKYGLPKTTETRLSGLLAHRDRRVAANVIEVFTRLNIVNVDVKELLSKNDLFEDNRVIANLLIQEGQREITAPLIKKLRKILSSQEGPHLASGVYATGEIAKHHRQSDLVYYSAQIELGQLVESIIPLVVHNDAMVRRQSYLAICKIEDPKYLEMLNDLLNSHEHKDLKQDLEVLIKKKTESAA